MLLQTSVQRIPQKTFEAEARPINYKKGPKRVKHDQIKSNCRLMTGNVIVPNKKGLKKERGPAVQLPSFHV